MCKKDSGWHFPIFMNINKHRAVCSLYLAYLSYLSMAWNEQGVKSQLNISDSAKI